MRSQGFEAEFEKRVGVMGVRKMPKRTKAFSRTLGRTLPTAITVKILVDVIYAIMGLK